MDYTEHGRFSLQGNGRIICIRATGQWNEETAAHYAREVRQLAEPLRSDAWATLMDLRSWELGVPEVEQHLAALDLWCVEAGQTHTAVIEPGSAVVLWHVRQLLSERRRSGAVQFFEDAFSASSWLQATGFRFDEGLCRTFFEGRQLASLASSNRTAR